METSVVVFIIEWNSLCRCFQMNRNNCDCLNEDHFVLVSKCMKTIVGVFIFERRPLCCCFQMNRNYCCCLNCWMKANVLFFPNVLFDFILNEDHCVVISITKENHHVCLHCKMRTIVKLRPFLNENFWDCHQYGWRSFWRINSESILYNKIMEVQEKLNKFKYHVMVCR